ncbi:MAG: hypothetical protein ACE5I5_01400 [Candidatus Heimdallarchaeota archaeon]
MELRTALYEDLISHMAAKHGRPVETRTNTTPIVFGAGRSRTRYKYDRTKVK